MSDQSTETRTKPLVAYASHVNVGITVYDVALTFGIGSDDEVEQQVRVHMSPQHARSLHILLGRFLDGYERQVGPIALPDSLVRRLKGEPDPNEEEGEADDAD